MQACCLHATTIVAIAPLTGAANAQNELAKARRQRPRVESSATSTPAQEAGGFHHVQFVRAIPAKSTMTGFSFKPSEAGQGER
jgi:ubiquitin